MAIFNLKRKKKKVDYLENVNLETIYVDGVKYQTVITEKYKKRKHYTNDTKKAVYSKIPGTILSINVKEGDSINIGDILCVLDSMKMNNNIISPFNGVVKKVCVNVNDAIVKGAALVEFEDEVNNVVCDNESDEFEQDEIDNSYTEGLENIDLDEEEDDDDVEDDVDVENDNVNDEEKRDVSTQN